jgi:ADP-heptose:LPS heptosyltransferase
VIPQLEPLDEVLVFDTGSTDGTRAWLANTGLPVRFALADDTGFDFASARNTAVQEARGKIVAFLDDDCVAPRDWLGRIKKVLATHDAVGGLVLPGCLYDFPGWWSAEIAWAIGMSPSAVVLGRDDAYPATANFAALKSLLTNCPFQATPHRFGSPALYLGGREDAHWWLEARQRGNRVVVDRRLIVFHSVPEQRLRFKQVCRRAKMDGEAAWQRRPVPEIAESALRDGFSSIFLSLVHPIRSLRNPPATASSFLWAIRQLALARRAGKARLTSAPWVPGTAATACASALRACRSRLGVERVRMQRTLRPSFHVPDPPHHLLIAAPTFLGDSVLLQPVVRLLARNWPTANIVVWTRFPEIFDLDEFCVRVMTDDPRDSAALRNYARWASEVNFVPYYHHGDFALWRKVLSLRGVTFTGDVGFPRDRDYYLPPVTVPKDYSRHEMLNLLRLVSLWPMSGDLDRPRLRPGERVMEEATALVPDLGSIPFFTLQLGSGLEMKRWPVERWEILARETCRQFGLHCVFIGDSAEALAGEHLVERLGTSCATSLCGRLTVSQLIAVLSRARLAIGTCSGPKHLAYALGTPTFTIYGPSSPARWGAWFDHERHACVCSPIGYLSAVEHANLTPNHAMLRISAETALEGLLAHAEKLGIGLRNFS